MTLDSKITEISGVGTARAGLFARLGIFTVRDLLYHIPRAYQNRGLITYLSDAEEKINSSFILTVATTPKVARLKRNITVTKFRAFDESGDAEITFFNQDYLQNVFMPGLSFRFFGKIEKKGRIFRISSPEYELINEGKPLRDFVPVYPLTAKLTEKAVSKAVAAALKSVLPTIIDPMPENILRKYSLPGLQFALANIHFPDDDQSLNLSLKRLTFDEFFYFSLCISMSRKKLSEQTAPSMKNTDITEFLKVLPYELTGAQKRAINEILSDMKGDGSLRRQMSRILIGDVGSGKTVCAAAAVYVVSQNGYQSAIMAPTEILAKQHFEYFSNTLGPFGIKVAVLLGSTTKKNKELIYNGLKSGDIQVIIGTHALLSDKVEFKSPAFTITDEQHRFGVMQRAELKEKGNFTHTLVMSATPIPRTLALSLYGDLDISRIDEMPIGRKKVETFAVDENYRERINKFIEKTVFDGGQVYIVCPAIEESEKCEIPLDTLDFANRKEGVLPLKSAVSCYEKLKNEVFPHFKIALLHGKMKAEEKEHVMQSFVDKKIDILVSTTVIEVGVNVPNASLMIIENAERFGLSQLHQLRGRVGRGNRKSYCILMSDAHGQTARSRIHTLTVTNDGYKIAEQDLLQRGPGDFFSGIYSDEMRQSGGFAFKFSGLCNDSLLMECAFKAAKDMAESEIPKNIKSEVLRLFKIKENTIS